MKNKVKSYIIKCAIDRAYVRFGGLLMKNQIQTIKLKKEKRAFSYWRIPFFAGAGIYLEVLFHLAIYHKLESTSIYPVLFGATLGLFLAALTVWLPRIGNEIIAYVGLTVFCVYDIVQLLYFRIFGTFLSLVSVGGAGNAMDFKVVMFEKIRQNVGWMLLFMLPVIALVLLRVFLIKFDRPKMKIRLISVASAVCLCTISILLLNVQGRAMYSPYQLFHNQYVLELSMNKLGVCVTTVRDAQTMLTGGKKNVTFTLDDSDIDNVEALSDAALESGATSTDASSVATDTDAAPVYVEQVDPAVDFKKLYQAAEDEQLKNLSAYCAQQTPTMQNEYTGMFEGYNVVCITAESLCKYGIYENCTPTLYKIMNDGFVFENYYNPIWYHSTIDGEFVDCLGQYPCSSEWSFYKSADTYQPYALGNALNAKGYTSKAYHDFDFYYYNRSETHANMGYDFKAIDYGLDIPSYVTYSDYDTIEAVYKEFIDEEPFLMYFMTFSGHLPYNYDYNAMCLKNREEAEKCTEGMDLPEDAVAYIAAQMELDKALEDLINKLDEAGKLEKTVFIVTPDHYPYGLTDSGYDALAGKNVSDDAFEKHHSCLGIWSASMEEPVHVKKLCASVDVLPTVLNLLGVTYDSRILAGHDILSDSEELVIFADHSFKTDKIGYNTKTGEVTYYVDEKTVSQSYIDDTIKEVETKLYMSDEVINTDFYGYVYGKKSTHTTTSTTTSTEQQNKE